MPLMYVPGIARVFYDSIQNSRNTQADYVAVLDGSWALAVAVCDGAGDDSDAADAAQISAQIAAAVTGSTNSGVQGLHAARTYLQQRNEDAPPGQEGITTAVVAAITPGGLDMAWVGDSPAWAVRLDSTVVPLTVPSCHPRWTPCNVEEKHEAGGTWPHRMLTNTDDYARIILASDGLTAHLPLTGRADHMNAMLDDLTRMAAPDLAGEYVAAQLLDMARQGRGRDHTTVAVIDLITHEGEPT
ncbi:protein phosphatase 2C domain-containing protein [Nonomuraea sp. NEAU-A123]|uniref:protein phosphatase 2C domain-containing protein n=1 Tax=Nonomuraea sp. NEAU-A123 TaxID=2839649 RepID=UPI001BE4B3C3|nr:protein phosphatase 2C domain-containing protein [Nonomuraea sp. NEAU-A123]MBT2234985.1 protein phosphatase 2C domain-containing protein [Nonomuraea sp. NEAU-A123]